MGKLLLYRIDGRRQGEHVKRSPAPEIGNIVLEKGCYFEGYFFKHFPKIVKNSLFQLNSNHNFLHLSQSTPTTCILSHNQRKTNPEF